MDTMEYKKKLKEALREKIDNAQKDLDFAIKNQEFAYCISLNGAMTRLKNVLFLIDNID